MHIFFVAMLSMCLFLTVYYSSKFYCHYNSFSSLMCQLIMFCRQKISASDITTIIAFFERTQDMVCIEDVLHMIIRALSHKSLLASFLEQVNLLGGCHVFINLLERCAFCLLS